MPLNLIVKYSSKIIKIFIILMIVQGFVSMGTVLADDLNAVKKSGILRHLGIPYANFVTQDRMGLDVELMQQFAKYLQVDYQFVETTWQGIIPDLTGKTIKIKGNNVEVTGKRPIKGDVIATGFTVLPWREKIVDFSARTFPSGIWLIARSDASLSPISPSGDIVQDIKMVKNKMSGISVLGLKESCLDPGLYDIKKTGAKIHFFPVDRDLEEMIPSVIGKMADTTLMDVPVALIALAKWPGKIKVIGPLSEPQDMACAFSKDSPELKLAFDLFFNGFKKSGGYRTLVKSYYPSVFSYYPKFL